MKSINWSVVTALLGAALLLTVPSAMARKDKAPKAKSTTRLLYWNIQNGMWSDQGEDYVHFVNWVKEKNPDICVWCEAQPIYKTGTGDKLDNIKEWKYNDELLFGMWHRISKRYGHRYVYLSGHRDYYPQVVTSRYPLEIVHRMVGNADTTVVHGAGWYRLKRSGKTVNIVTIHSSVLPKHQRRNNALDYRTDYYLAMEMGYILDHTYKTSPDPDSEYWMMMGDFNSFSRVDNYFYHWEEDDSRFLCQDAIAANSSYIDVIQRTHPGEFIPTVGSKATRKDFLYLTQPLFDRVQSAEIVWDDYTTPVRDPEIHNFWHPSDHLPIIVDLKLKD